MGFLSSIFGRSKEGGAPRFMTDEGFRQNLANQVRMSPLTVAELRERGVSASASRKLDFFFYTNAQAKGQALANALRSLGYQAKDGLSAAEDGQFAVRGQSTPLRMDEETVVAWTERMCHLGFEHDCEFDGWGTGVKEQE